MAQLDIIAENNDYVVVNKTAGLISEKSRYENTTVENQVLEYFSKTKKNPYVGVVHRLDRVTSGVLMFAKKKSVLVAFNELFSSRKVQKTYLAIVSAKPPKVKGHLVNFLVKNTKEKRADIVASKSKHTQDCRLSYKVIAQNEFGYILEVKPETGRFHQIRVQLAHIGLPIIGDEKYGSNHEYMPFSICLHAWKLTYEISGTKESQTFEAPLPDTKFWEFKAFKQ